MEIPFAPIEAFYSFAQADAPLLVQLERHLSVLRHEGQITTWHRRQIAAGGDWQRELDQHLNTASLILLLISPDFLASNYLYGVELQQAMRRHHANEAHVIPIVLRPCDWKGTPFEKLQIVPRNHLAITEWRNRDAGFAEIAKEIRAALQTMQRLTLSTTPTTLPRIWQIPFLRNPFFTGREELLAQIAASFLHGATTALSQPQAMSGLGGIGKTQIAVEYAYWHRQEYQAVLWCLAESEEALTAGYVAIAKALSLPEQEEQEHTITVQTVIQWLRTHQQWLLILDNADDLGLLRPFLPSPCEGHIVLTTRAFAMGGLAQRVEVEVLEETAGAVLLLRRAGLIAANGEWEDMSLEEQMVARALSQDLGGLPLALDQAGAYIEETGCSLRSYHQQYQSRHATPLLRRRGGVASDHPEPVATTWSLSFEKVEQANPLAAEVLRCCAFLAPDTIPEELILQVMRGRHLPNRKEQETDEEGLLSSRTAKEEARTLLPGLSRELDEAAAVLRAYSLIQRQAQDHLLQVHRLVQAVVRDGMNEQEWTIWITDLVDAVEALFPWAAFDNWEQCERYLPQVQVCARWIEQENLLLVKGAWLCYRAGLYLFSRALYAEAETLYQQALRTWEHNLGPEHPQVASALYSLAILYHEQGRYAEAEPLYQRALRIREQSVGPEHPSTASSLNNLANLYREQGKYAEAELLFMRALAIYEHILGRDHPNTQTVRANYASLLRTLERNTDAKQLEVEP